MAVSCMDYSSRIKNDTPRVWFDILDQTVGICVLQKDPKKTSAADDLTESLWLLLATLVCSTLSLSPRSLFLFAVHGSVERETGALLVIL
jgi:hypothetical protein